MKLSSVTAVFALLALASGCSTAPVSDIQSVRPAEVTTPTLDLESDLFGERPQLPTVKSIHALSEAQRLAFQTYFHHPANRRRPAHKRVFDYLQLETSNFGFRGETYTATEALDNAAGNCLSLAILTTALAELAEVEIEYQLIDSDPVFESGDNQIRRSLHIRSLLYDPEWSVPDGFWAVIRPRIKVDYFPGDLDRVVGRINEADYHALYYQNIAADALEHKDLNRAYWLVMESLQIAPLNPESLNMLAIIFGRANDQRKSEEIYRFGIRHAKRRVSLLRNYAIFLERVGRHEEAEKISAQVAKLDDPNPFDWIYAGQQAYRSGQYERAIDLFTRSAKLAPYLHESQFGLAKTYFSLGNEYRAQKALEQALSLAARSSTRQLYQAKLDALRVAVR